MEHFLCLRVLQEVVARGLLCNAKRTHAALQPTATSVDGERYEKGEMATPELQVLRHGYKAAYTGYMVSVQALSDASQRGEWPDEDVLKAEEKAFNELSYLRQALIGALLAHKLKG